MSLSSIISRSLATALSPSNVLARCCSSKTITDDVYKLLQSIVGEKNASRGESVRSQHSHDESFHSGYLPDVVIWPQSVDQVSHVAKLCHKHHIPMVPFGTGSGMEGGVVSVEQGQVVINLTNMDEIPRYHPEDLDVSVQPGVTRIALNHYLKNDGLYFPIDPGADASVCGMCATSASGTNAVRYGTMKDNVLNLEVVLADGTVIHTAGKHRRTRKSVAGYNLTNLFVGSEGTLGIITEATVRVYGIPEKLVSAVCTFDDVRSAVDCVTDVMQSGIQMSRIEFVDDQSILSANLYSHLELKEAQTLFLEFQGTESSVAADIETVEGIVQYHSGSEFQYADTVEERNKLWTARHNLWYALLARRPGAKGYSTDVCVPMSQLPDMITSSKEDLDASGMIYVVVGHVGDGNFHCAVMVNTDDKDELRKLEEFNTRLVRRALAADGTCTGEHGVGLGKRKFLLEEFDKSSLNLMGELKRTLDPLNLLNPGKVLLKRVVESE